MSLETLLTTYGYPLLFLGTFLEGETILLVAGFLAARNYLQLPWVICTAFLGSLAGDQLFFHLGRIKGAQLIARRPQWQIQAAKIQARLQTYHIPIILGFRFLYGLRNITPFAIGMSAISTKKFLLLNATGALVWSVVVSLLGYAFGEAFEAIFHRIKCFELLIISGIFITGGLLWLRHFWRRKKAL
jgi:membrane protein DedA with SNARE-associated domain